MSMDEGKLERLRDYFSRQPVDRAYLFGSFARGVTDNSSDVDILVELDHTRPIGLHFIQMILDLEAMLDRPVDLVTTNALSPYVKPYVDRDKRLIYARA